MRLSVSLRRHFSAIAVALVLPAAAHAQIAWTDWTSTSTNAVFGTLISGSNTIAVSFSGPYSFAQTSCGTNFWVNPAAYSATGPADAPPGCDIVALDQGGLKTITFSQAVVNPLIAIVSWNGQPPVVFNGPLQVVSQGCGYWGCGTISTAGNTLSASGEAHGTLRLLGTYTQVSFTDGSENWHGIGVGVESVAVTATPEPATMVLMGSGLLGMFGVVRRRRAA